jgi:hypothetical protein
MNGCACFFQATLSKWREEEDCERTVSSSVATTAIMGCFGGNGSGIATGAGGCETRAAKGFVCAPELPLLPRELLEYYGL